MSFIGKLFGTEEGIDSVVNSFSNGLDALVSTEEENGIVGRRAAY